MKKNEIKGYIILAAILVVFSVIAFAISFTKTAVFWISYVFGFFAIAFQIYTFKNAFHGAEAAKSKFYGFPIVKVGIYYLFIQLLVSMIGIILSVYCPIWVILILSVILIGFAVIGCVTADIMREEVIRQDTQLKKDVSKMRSMQAMANAMASQECSKEMKVLLQKLAEEFRYSDPVTSDETNVMEEELLRKMNELQKLLVEQKEDVVIDNCNQIILSLVERNRICMLSK